MSSAALGSPAAGYGLSGRGASVRGATLDKLSQASNLKISEPIFSPSVSLTLGYRGPASNPKNDYWPTASKLTCSELN